MTCGFLMKESFKMGNLRGLDAFTLAKMGVIKLQEIFKKGKFMVKPAFIAIMSRY